MSEKRYANINQKKILEQAGIEHFKGRSFEEAEILIDQCIADGQLPPDIRDRASYRQLEALRRLGIEYPHNISKSDASTILDRHSGPATSGQREFIAAMGGRMPPDLTRRTANAMIEKLTLTFPISDGQASLIYKLGGVVIRSMTYANAGLFIQYLLEHKTSCESCGESHDRRSDRCECGAYLNPSEPIHPPPHLLSDRANKKNSFAFSFFRWLSRLMNG